VDKENSEFYTNLIYIKNMVFKNNKVVLAFALMLAYMAQNASAQLSESV